MVYSQIGNKMVFFKATINFFWRWNDKKYKKIFRDIYLHIEIEVLWPEKIMERFLTSAPAW